MLNHNVETEGTVENDSTEDEAEHATSVPRKCILVPLQTLVDTSSISEPELQPWSSSTPCAFEPTINSSETPEAQLGEYEQSPLDDNYTQYEWPNSGYSDRSYGNEVLYESPPSYSGHSNYEGGVFEGIFRL